jgi:hypothetical protein
MCSELRCFVLMAQSSLRHHSTEKDGARSRAVDFDVTVRAVRVLCVQVVLWTSRLVCTNTVRDTVASQTELRYSARNQQTRIGRTVRGMTRNAPISLDRGMLVNKRSLLVCVTLDAGSVGAGRESRLFKLETAVRIVAIAALHRPFEHLVMERQVELVLRLAMTTETKLGLAISEQFQIGKAWLLCVCS